MSLNPPQSAAQKFKKPIKLTTPKTILREDVKIQTNNRNIRSSQSFRPSFSLKNKASINCNIDEGDLSEKEITKKVNEYRMTLNKELLKLLSEQRVKEHEREILLSQTTDTIQRNNLIYQFYGERSLASNQILKFNEYLILR